jgi:hypothetical protein
LEVSIAMSQPDEEKWPAVKVAYDFVIPSYAAAAESDGASCRIADELEERAPLDLRKSLPRPSHEDLLAPSASHANRSAEKNRDFLDLRSGDSARHGGDING